MLAAVARQVREKRRCIQTGGGRGLVTPITERLTHAKSRTGADQSAGRDPRGRVNREGNAQAQKTQLRLRLLAKHYRISTGSAQ